jgi:tyrosyl-tRNA synthetase
MPILVGLDGKERMSKSKGNHIGVNDSANEQYGKAMSLPDEAVMDFFVLATNVPPTELEGIAEDLKREPMATKKRLARTIAAEFWGAEAAQEAEAQFERTVQRKEVPAEIPAFRPSKGQLLLDVLAESGLTPSRREARRLVEQGAVSIDGSPARVSDVAEPGTTVQVGKRRWLRLVD